MVMYIRTNAKAIPDTLVSHLITMGISGQKFAGSGHPLNKSLWQVAPHTLLLLASEPDLCFSNVFVSVIFFEGDITIRALSKAAEDACGKRKTRK